jgi:hypothetical protein
LPGVTVIYHQEKIMRTKMKLEDLYETPRTIADLDDPSELDLMDKVKNKAYYNEYSGPKYQHKKKLFDLTEYAAVFQYKTEFFCLDTNRKRVTYYMHYKVNNNKILGQYVWQSLVWTLDIVHGEYLVGVASKIFFDYLLPKFEVIVTDSEQTWKGQRFWKISIGTAINKGLNVYFYDFANHNIQQLTDTDELDDYQAKYDIWGIKPAHEMKRMVISNKKLV